jgi:putative ABC transport system permease protein
LISTTISGMRAVIRRFRWLSGRRQLERDMDDEMRLHLELEAADLMRSGLAADEAWRRARVAFGGIERFKDEGRDARGVRWLDDLTSDARYGARQLRRSLGFASAALVTLALGIGAGTAMYSMTRAIFLTPFPFDRPESLVFLEQCGLGCRRMAVGNFLTIRRETRTLADVAASVQWGPTIRGRETTDVAAGTRVSVEYFRVIGARATLGRTFAPDDTLPGRPPVAVLADGAWRARFGADSAVIGAPIVLDGVAHTIVGIVPDGLTPERTEVFGLIPIDATAAADRFWTDYTVFARLRPGTTLADVNAELATLTARLDADSTGTKRRQRFTARALVEWNTIAWKPIVAFMTAVGFVLIIACINLAGLLLARLTAREREIAVRAAMGAGAGRLVRQLLTETLLLSGVGGLLGVATAWAIVGIARVAVPADTNSGLPGWSRLATDWHSLVLALALGALTGAVIGLGPAYRFSRPDLVEALKEGMRATGGRASRLRRALVVAEVAFSIVLLSAAGLLARSTVKRAHANLGFQSDHVLTMRLRHPPERDSTRRRPADFYDRLVREVDGVPGVERAATVSFVPLTGFTSFGFDIEGRPWPEGTSRPSGRMQAATAGYFETLRIPIRRGRSFTDADDANATPVAIINETVARRFFTERGDDPLGAALILQNRRFQVVGVAGDVFHSGTNDGPWNEIYYVQQQWPRRDLSLVVRTKADPASVADAVTRVVRRYDADIGVSRVATLEALLSERLAQNTVMAVLMGVFAGIALLISAMGLYGVISYSVSQRTREFGIRLTLGADRRRLLGLVMRDGVRLAALGSAVGLAAALGVMRLMRFLLYGIDASDPLTLAGVVLTLTAIALAASYIPARRATKVDPMSSLRAE